MSLACGAIYRRATSLALLLLSLPGAAFGAAPEALLNADTSAIMEDIRRFEALGSRMTGTEGCDRAAEIIRERFVRIGLQNVIEQPFDVVVPITRHVRLTVDGTDIPVHPLWPNGVRTATVQGTLRGPLVWAGRGGPEAFNGQDVDGSIVLLEGDLGADWFHAPMLGARAVVFLETGEATQAQMMYKFSSVPIPTPRFWAAREAGDRLKEILQSAKTAGRTPQFELTCRVDWETRQGRNLFGFLPGSDPAEAGDVMVVEAYYDAISAVPDLTPGAEGALNIALLLHLAEQFKQRPPARPVLFAAFAGHYQALRGARVFADLYRHDPDKLAAEIRDLEETVRGLAPSYRELVAHLETLRDMTESERGKAKGEKDDTSALRPSISALLTEVLDLARRLGPDMLTAPSQMPALNRIRAALRDLRARLKGPHPPPVEAGLKPASTAMGEGEVYDRAGKVLTYLDLLEAREVKANKARLKLFRLTAHRETADRLGRDLLSKIRFFYALDLSSHGKALGLFYKAFFIDQHEKNYETTLRQAISPVAYRATDLAASLSGRLGLKGETWVDGVNSTGGLSWQTHLPVPLGVDLEMPMLAGLPGAAFISTDDPRLWVDTPLDRSGRMDAEQLDLQARLLVPLLWDLLSDPEALGRYREVHREALLSRERFRRVHGRAVAYDPARSLGVADQPVGGALMTVQHNPGFYNRQRAYKTYGGVRAMDLTFADGGGFFEFIGLPDTQAKWWDTKKFTLEGYLLDPASGEVRCAPDRGDFGERLFKVQEIELTRPEHEVTPVLFRCEPVTVFDMMDQRSFATFVNVEVYDAQTGSAPISWGYRIAGRVYDKTYTEPAGAIFIPPRMRFKARFGMGDVAGVKYALLNVADGSHDPPDGAGYPTPEGGVLALTPMRMALDLHRLDEGRLTRLRTHGIRNAHVEGLHAAAGEALAQAQEALRLRRYDAFLRHARSAWSLEARAYPHVQGTTLDVLAGVLLYLFLLLPFAFFAERLLFGFTNINAQIGGFFGVFLIAFLILSQVHPAFAITNAAPVILLAFITLTLSLLVIAMIRSRFQQEIARLQRRPGAGERSDFSRLSAAKTAFILGINNMRRRRVRTGLTVATLVLLMFSVLSLSSIESQLVIQRRLLTEEPPPYEGVLLRNRNWGNLPASAYGNLLNAFPPEEGHVVAPRNWIVSQDVNVPTGVRLTNPLQPDREFRLAGLVGMSPEETRLTRPQDLLVAGRWLKPGEEEACVLPRKIASELRLEWGQTPPEVTLYGRRLRVVGLLDDAKLLRWKDVDQESPGPVDYSIESWQRHSGANRDDDRQFYHYAHLDPRNVLFAPYALLLDYGATLRSVALIPKEQALKEVVEREILKKVDIPVFLASRDRVVYASSTRGSAVSGVGLLLIPMFISALIVFNTMLGSVYEREREISIYGSMGLAPVHISSLFVAESCVYATVSAVLGYILGQVVAKLITMQGLLSGLSLNYSSTSAAFAAVFIAGVVLLSALYPARRAAALSVPDVERIWRLPAPEGDLLDVEFPFTISAGDALGVNAYLLYYFQDHSRQSVGEFYTARNRLSALPRPGGTGYGLRSDVWIAPFDFGISQRLEMQTLPTEDPNVFQTRLLLTRASGENDAWVKMNNRFLKHIRKQFLLWRLLKPEERAFYRAEAQKALEETAESVT